METNKELRKHIGSAIQSLAFFLAYEETYTTSELENSLKCCKIYCDQALQELEKVETDYEVLV